MVPVEVQRHRGPSAVEAVPQPVFMSKATQAIRPRMGGGRQHSKNWDVPAARVLARASVEETLGIAPQQFDSKTLAEIKRANRIHDPDCPCLANLGSTGARALLTDVGLAGSHVPPPLLVFGKASAIAASRACASKGFRKKALTP